MTEALTKRLAGSNPPAFSVSEQHARDRRQFFRQVIYGGLAFSGMPAFARATVPPLGHVVVVGAGFAGLTAAKYLRLWSMGNIAVTLIEPNPQFVSCPQSNLVLGGIKSLDALSFSYHMAQQQHGIRWLKDRVTAVDPATKRVYLANNTLSYDKLVLAQGVDFNYQAIPGMAKPVSHIPHAWKAGQQTLQLQQQLAAMPDGGVFVMTIPKAPYRCPPGPYERACMVAHYFKQHKPNSKVIVLDANPDIVSKKGLFAHTFETQYRDIIDYRRNSEIVDIDATNRTVKTDFETVQAAVLNVIPPQLAGSLAQSMSLNNVDKRWCEVDFVSYASNVQPDIHVIGDSISAGLPKSAHMASAQAKICAQALVDLMTQRAPNPLPVFANTCYSFVDDKAAIHVANVYRYDATKKVMVSAEGGGVSTAASALEGQYAHAWANHIWADTLT